MGEVRPLPTLGGVFFDTRRSARAMRVSWHTDDGSVVLSIWDGAGCTGTIRLLAADVPELIRSLGLGLPDWHLAGPVPPPRPAGPPQPTAAAPAVGPAPAPGTEPARALGAEPAREPGTDPDGGPGGQPVWPAGEPSRTD